LEARGDGARAYTDPRTGQPVIRSGRARELIDMLDALHEKTKGNLAPKKRAWLLVFGRIENDVPGESIRRWPRQAAQASKAKTR